MAGMVILIPQAADVSLQFEVESREDVTEQGFLKIAVQKNFILFYPSQAPLP